MSDRLRRPILSPSTAEHVGGVRTAKHPNLEDAIVKKLISLAFIAAVALGRTAHPQAQVPPDPGAAATPGTTNPSKSDPSTTTPGVVSPGPAPTDSTSRAERPTSRSEPTPSRSPTRLAE